MSHGEHHHNEQMTRVEDGAAPVIGSPGRPPSTTSRILRCVQRWPSEHDGSLPSHADVAASVGVVPGVAYNLLQILKRRGLVEAVRSSVGAGVRTRWRDAKRALFQFIAERRCELCDASLFTPIGFDCPVCIRGAA